MVKREVSDLAEVSQDDFKTKSITMQQIYNNATNNATILDILVVATTMLIGFVVSYDD